MGVAFSFSKRLPVYGISFMRILLTGGTGFIGSHTAALLLEAGHDVVLYDNLSNSRAEVVDRLERITGRRPVLVVGDIRDEEAMRRALHEHRIKAVIHFAGLKAVGESVEKPLEYYDNNIVGTLRLLEAMRAEGVKSLIFSSSSFFHTLPAISCNCGISISSTSFFALYWSMMEGILSIALRKLRAAANGSAIARCPLL